MIALFQAKTAVELTLGTEQDTASPSTRCRRGRPRRAAPNSGGLRVNIVARKQFPGRIMTEHTLSGQVALVEDDYTLVINRGAEAGVTPGMVLPCSPSRIR